MMLNGESQKQCYLIYLMLQVYTYYIYIMLGNNYISKNEYESFADMINDVGDR